jgi:hypothetical protein
MNTQPVTGITPRAMPIERGTGWLLDGFGYFSKSPMAWIGTIILLIIIGGAISFIPIIGALAPYLLMPVIMGGLMLGCQAQSQGGEFTVNHLFAGFSNNTAQLVALGLIYMLGVIVITVVIVVIFFALIGGTAILQDIQAGNPEVIANHLNVILMGILIMLALYLPLLMALWFAPALVVLNDVSPVEALKLSFKACLMNILPFTLYGIVGLVLMIIAAIPLGLGMLILIPMITASVYISYSEIFNAK